MISGITRYGLIAGIVFAGWSSALPTDAGLSHARTLAKRAPVTWDWDDTLPNASDNLAKAKEGWQDMLQLAAKIHRKTDAGRWDGIFSHYFNDDKKDKIRTIFRTILGAKDENDQGDISEGGGSEIFAHIIITNKDQGDGDDCRDNPDRALAFLINDQNDPLPDPPADDDFQGTIRICDLGYKFPALRETTCDKLDEEVSGKMSTLGGIFLHEITHYDGLMWKALQLKDGTDDIRGQDGYGAKAVREIKENTSDDESNNADNYRWFAQEVWWSHVCNVDYKPATSNLDYVQCKDKDGNEATCEMPFRDPVTASEPPTPPPPPPPPPPKTKALSIVMQNYIDEISNENSWLFFGVDVGTSAVCKDEKEAVAKYPAGGDAGTIDNPPWPAGTYAVNVDNMQCEYKNDGNDNAGALWCNGRDAIICNREDLMGAGEDGTSQCGPQIIWSVQHHPVVYCEW